MMESHPSLNKETQTQTPTNDDSLNLREQLERYLAHWKWFVLSVLLCVAVAFAYLRYTIPRYKASSTILVKDERKGGLPSELSAFDELGLTKALKSSVDNEIEVIKSYTLIETTVKRLNFNIAFYTEGMVKTVEVYEDNPIQLQVFDPGEHFYTKPRNYTVKSFSPDKYELLAADGKSMGTYKFGAIVQLEHCKISVKPHEKRTSQADFAVKVSFKRLADVALSFRGNLTITPVGKNTSVVELGMTHPVRQKAEDFLDKLIFIYNEEAIADKSYITKNTEQFIKHRIDLISEELGDVEKNVEKFLTENRLTDVVSESGLYLQNSALYEKQLIETETQLSIVASMIEYMKTIKIDDLVPINIIPVEGNTSALISEHNQLVLELNRIAKGGTAKNTAIINLEKKIEGLNENIAASLQTLRNSLLIRKRDLEFQRNQNTGRISQVPRQTRQFRDVERQQQIKESLYLYLLQKREEIAISLAVTPPNVKVIDSARSSAAPISPKRGMVFMGAFIIGLLLPAAVVYGREMLDTKVKNRSDVEQKLSIPFLGDVPRSESEDEIISANSRSSSAEAIRIVRTNLEFLLTQVPEGQARTVFVSSTLPKEGKTFVAVNLATTIALSQKKVLLVGLDIRNPKLDRYIKLPSKGLTNYLSTKDDSVENYIVPVEGHDCLWVLPSGVIPPNPVELLMNPRVERLFTELKAKFDYIIVDTAPVSVVTDTLLIAKNADAFIYVMRANYLDKRLLKLADSFYREKKLPNMSIVLNDTLWGKPYGYGAFGYGYGYGYGTGYGYAADPVVEPWYKRIFKRS